jgi:hypothetical protein
VLEGLRTDRRDRRLRGTTPCPAHTACPGAAEAPGSRAAEGRRERARQRPLNPEKQPHTIRRSPAPTDHLTAIGASTPWPRPPSACTRTSASAPTHPFRRGPLRTLSDVELTTADYVPWFDQQRLMHRLGRVPPAEAESRYLCQSRDRSTGRLTEPRGCMNPGRFSQTSWRDRRGVRFTH